MIRPRLTVRVRLTLLYTALFALGGAIIVAITYGLVAASLQTRQPDPADAKFLAQCKEFLGVPTTDPTTRKKCEAAVREGVGKATNQQRDAALASLLRSSIGTLVIVTALSAAGGWVVAGRALRPVHRITEAARAASERNLTARVGLTGPRDELRELADTFDAMLDRLQAGFESQRRFIANASHELRTPLTVMRAAVDVVLARPAPARDELLGMGREVRTAVDHAEGLIAALLTLASNDRGLTTREPVDLATVAEDLLDTADTGELAMHVALQPAPTLGDPLLLERLAGNLLDNAVRYNVPDGEIWLATSMVHGRAVLTIGNTGEAIAPEAVPELFEPFRRLHERTGVDGFGLGLAIVASIATTHGGAVEARARADGGLQVTVTLPGADQPAADR